MICAGAQADIIHRGSGNPGFELGDLTDWTATLSPTVGNSPGGTATVVASTLTLDGTRYDGFVAWAPMEGGKFALLRGGPTDIYQKLSTLFTAAAGDRVVFNVPDPQPRTCGGRFLKPTTASGGRRRRSEWDFPCQATGSACCPPKLPTLLPP